jgi:hypothetical protein
MNTPYDAGDRLTEVEFARRIKRNPRTIRSWRVKRTGPPFVRDGRRILYSWQRYLQYLRENEEQPARGVR